MHQHHGPWTERRCYKMNDEVVLITSGILGRKYYIIEGSRGSKFLAGPGQDNKAEKKSHQKDQQFSMDKAAVVHHRTDSVNGWFAANRRRCKLSEQCLTFEYKNKNNRRFCFLLNQHIKKARKNNLLKTLPTNQKPQKCQASTPEYWRVT